MPQRSTRDYVLVGLQFLLFGLLLLDFGPHLSFSNLVKTAGLGTAIKGTLVTLTAMLQLNKSLTAFPTPKEDATLIKKGLYNVIRHPIYSGVLLIVFGYAIYSSSGWRLGVALALAVLFYVKTEYEETQLRQKFPEYADYVQSTGRFIPKLKFKRKRP